MTAGERRRRGAADVAARALAGVLFALSTAACHDDQLVPVAELMPRVTVTAPAAVPASVRCTVAARRRGGVYIPWNGRAAVHALLPRDGAVQLASPLACGGGSGELQLRVATESGTYRRVVGLPARRAARLEHGEEGGPARIEIAAVAAEAPAAGGVIVTSLALVRPAPGPPVPRTDTTGGRRPDIVIYLVDTLRADALGCYGPRRGLTPNLDRFAREATLFAHAVAQSSWTRPAVASIFTGLRPLRHGVHDDQGLGGQALTLAELLRASGYRTGAWITNPNVGAQLGFDQGFDSFQRLPRSRSAAGHVQAAFAQWLAGAAADPRPFFAYLHLMEPHAPYTPPLRFRRRFAGGAPRGIGTAGYLRRAHQALPAAGELRALRQLYDAEVAALDEGFGALRQLLERRGRWDDTVVVFVSDHGEAFGEHGRLEHGRDLHREVLDVPLIVRLPGGGAGRQVKRLVEQVDLFPTLLGIAGVSAPPPNDGVDLGALLRGERVVTPPRAAYAHLQHHDESWQAVITCRYRLLVRLEAGGDRRWLFSRDGDAQERHDLAAARPLALAALDDFRHWWTRTARAPVATPMPQLSAEERAELQALGYAR
jgi:arylsulfatase A-like enzyme